MAQATAVARSAEVAIVYGGTNKKIESKGCDRISLSLPGHQEDLVKSVCSTVRLLGQPKEGAGPGSRRCGEHGYARERRGGPTLYSRG